jgi:autonomous glycyl radical cofactor GrcA
MCLQNYKIDEFLKLDHEWIDRRKKEYGKTAICKCGERFDDYWQIQSKKEDYLISTSHLTISSISNNNLLDNSDHFYETVIIDLTKDKDKWLPFQARYKTKEDAIQGHELTYKKLEDIILNPDKYPQGLIAVFCNAINRTMDQKKTISQSLKKRLI